MKLDDLTILYLTLNKMPGTWGRFQVDHLRQSIGNTSVISISRVPMDLGSNLIQAEPPSYWNIYMQMLRGALLATTPYVAMAEDDTLYTPEHFSEFRPPMDKVAYDRSRWSLFTWDPNPIYCMRQRAGNCTLIAPREYLVEALTERSRVWGSEVPPNEIVGEVGRPVIDRRLHVSPRGTVEWYCTNPIIQLNHPTGMDTGDYGRADGRHMVKKHGQIKAVEIPYWGKAADIVRIYKDQQ